MTARRRYAVAPFAAGGTGLEQLAAPTTTTVVTPTTTAAPSTTTRPAPTTTTTVVTPPQEAIPTTTSGETAMALSVAPAGRSVQVKVTLVTPGHVAGVSIHMGDGAVLTAPPVTNTLCGVSSPARAIAPGSYAVRAVATIHQCVGVAPSQVGAAVTYRQG